MAKRKFHFSDGKTGAALTIRVIPRANHNEIVEILSDLTVKIRLTAPPVDGKANKALIEFLAEVLDVKKSRIEIVAGDTGRDKIVSIEDANSDEVHKILLDSIA